jgi:mycofactocin precursor peptide peptidase
MGRVGRLDEATWPELAHTSPLLIVPVGSCEQHGRHLPMATDTLIATALAERAVAAIDRTLLGPALTVTASGEHQGFPGTLSIGNEAMELLVVELVRSADWARGVVLVNGHGGNRTAIDAATGRLGHEGRRVLAWWPRRPDDVAPGDLHAGHLETSLLLALAPHLVDHAAAVAGPVVDRAATTLLTSEGVRAVSPDGVLGDPTAATAEHGRQLLDLLTDQLTSAIDAAVAAWDRSPT